MADIQPEVIVRLVLYGISCLRDVLQCVKAVSNVSLTSVTTNLFAIHPPG